MSVPNENQSEHRDMSTPIEFSHDKLRALDHRAASEQPGSNLVKFGTMPSLFTRVFPFPLSKPGENVHLWTKKNRHGGVALQRGVFSGEDGMPQLTTWAAGGYPRLLLIEVVHQIRTLSASGKDPRYIDLTPTLNKFITELQLPRNSHTRRALVDQLTAFVSSTITFTSRESRGGGMLVRSKNLPAIAEEVLMWLPEQSPLEGFQPHITASQWFIELALGDAAPVRTDFMARLVGKPLAMDVLLWLGRVTYELDASGKSSRTFTWPDLFDEFTHDYARLIDFRTRWKRALKQAMEYYPDVEIDPDYPDDHDKRRTVVRVYKSPLMIARK